MTLVKGILRKGKPTFTMANALYYTILYTITLYYFMLNVAYLARQCCIVTKCKFCNVWWYISYFISL